MIDRFSEVSTLWVLGIVRMCFGVFEGTFVVNMCILGVIIVFFGVGENFCFGLQ